MSKFVPSWQWGSGKRLSTISSQAHAHPSVQLQGYALVEYETYREAQNAIDSMSSGEILGKRVVVDWAFVKPKPVGRARR